MIPDSRSGPLSVLRPSHLDSSPDPFPRAGVAEMLLHSVLVGVLGDFHFQALRMYTQEKTALHGYYMYEVAVQPAGGTFGADPRVAGPGALPGCSLVAVYRHPGPVYSALSQCLLTVAHYL